MLTVEMKINGCLISHLYIHNTSNIVYNDTLYTYEYYEVGKSKIIKGSLLHRRSDGAEKLVQRILSSKEFE